MFFPKRGEVYYVNFDPTIGVEIKKGPASPYNSE